MDDQPTPDWPVIEPRRLAFALLPLLWEQLVGSWRKDQEGQGHPPLVSRGVELDLVGPALPPSAPFEPAPVDGVFLPAPVAEKETGIKAITTTYTASNPGSSPASLPQIVTGEEKQTPSPGS
jgi:hypothetical protein